MTIRDPLAIVGSWLDDKPITDPQLSVVRGVLAHSGPDARFHGEVVRKLVLSLDEARAELTRLRAGLQMLAAMPDGQEVVSIEDLRVSGDGSHVVHGPAFIAVHEEDLAARIEKLIAGVDDAGHSCPNCDGIDPGSCLMNGKPATAEVWVWEYGTRDGNTVYTADEYPDLNELKKLIGECFTDHQFEEVERRGIRGTSILVGHGNGRYADTGHWVYRRPATEGDAEILARVQARMAADSGNRTPLADVLAEHGLTEAGLEATD